jgi:hypothetical protein
MPAHYGAPAGRESSSRLSRAALLGGIAPGMAVSRIWFAATKLRPPPLPHSAVPRPQLLDRLQTLALARSLTLNMGVVLPVTVLFRSTDALSVLKLAVARSGLPPLKVPVAIPVGQLVLLPPTLKLSDR